MTIRELVNESICAGASHLSPQYFSWGWIDPSGEIHCPTADDTVHTDILQRQAEEYNFPKNVSEYQATRIGWIRWLVEYDSKIKKFTVFFNTVKVIKTPNVYASVVRIVNDNADANFFNFLSEGGSKWIQALTRGKFIEQLADYFGVTDDQAIDEGKSIGGIDYALAQINDLPVNPKNHNERMILDQNDNPVATIEVAERAGRLRIKSIKSLQKGRGGGSQALRFITQLADSAGVTIELTASPYGPESQRLDHDQLKAFYLRYGFEEEPGYDPALGYMIRKPNVSEGKPTGGLTKWFKEKWVNIAKKKGGKHPPCGTSGDKQGYAKCVPAKKAAGMTAKEKRSAVNRKRSAQRAAGRPGRESGGTGKKPIRVKTDKE